MRRAADRTRVDQLQRPFLPDRAYFRRLRSRGRVRLSDCGRVPRLGPLRAPALRAQRDSCFSADPVRGPGLCLGQARPRMGQESSGRLRSFMPLLNSLPDYVLTTKTDELLNWMRKSSVWYMLFGLACCAIELMHTGGPRVDIDRFGASPRAR